MKPSFASWLSLVFVIVSILGGLSCKEPLPAYKNPNEVFEGVLRPVYSYSRSDNTLTVFLTVVNTYDETFEGRALFDGSIEIAFARIPERKKTYYLSEANLVQARKYNPNSKVLTFDPRDSVRFFVKWNFVDDSGRDLREDAFNYHGDTTCGSRRIAASESFIIRGDVKIYDKTERVDAQPVIASLCHVNVWVDTKVCPLLLPEDACNFRSP